MKRENKDTQKAKKDILFDFLPYVIIIIVVILIRSFIATPVRVKGTSMFPTLKDGDIMILNKLGYKLKGIKRFDIVVINEKEEGSYIIKRVIGLPGETVSYVDGTLYINEKKVEDKYSKSITGDFKEVTLKNDEYFVLGDNRIISKDSRMIGPIKESRILGKTNITLFPITRFGLVED